MNVSIQRDVYAGMSENLTQRLNVEPSFYTSSCKSVPKGVELCLLKSASLEDGFETVCFKLGVKKVVSIWKKWLVQGDMREFFVDCFILRRWTRGDNHAEEGNLAIIYFIEKKK